ncbi:MAG: purine-nucleoside phosphorylase, partial [Bacteroidota bacterium]
MSALAAEPAPALADAVDAVRQRTDHTPELVLILGSGLGDLADEADAPTVVPADVIPNYPQSTVDGHHGG